MSRHRGWSAAVAIAAIVALVLTPTPPAALADTFDDACATPTIVDVGTNATYDLTSGQVLFIDSGTYTGIINNFPAGAVICVDAGATFQPSAFNGVGAAALYVRGTANISVGGFPGGFLLDNYGTVSFPGTLNSNGAVEFINQPAATMSAASANWQGTLSNAGNLTIGGTLNVNSGTIENQGQMTVNGQVSLNGAILNSGRLDIQGNLGVNSGGDVDNACTITVSGSTTLDAPGTSNNGQWLIGGNLLMNGSAALALDGVITANTLNNLDGDITGSGAIRIEGSSLQNGSSAVTGAPQINVYDVTQTNPPAFFDTQNGTVTNAVRIAFAVPDPDIPPQSCAPEPPVLEADLSVTKTGPATALVGQSVTYIITVTNNGPDTAEGVLLHESHDESFTITDVTVGGHLVGRSALWAAGDLDDGDSVVFEVTGFFTLTGPFTDEVGASSGTPDPDDANNEAEVTTVVQNRSPVVGDVTVVTDAFTPVDGSVPWSDPDAGQTVTFEPGGIQILALSPIAPDGSFTYTPPPSFAGREFFQVTGCDDGVPVLCDTGMIEAVVYPVAVDDAASTVSGSGVSIEIAINDSGGTGPPTIVSDPSSGSVVVQGDVFVYTPDPGFVGTDTFTYQICAPGEPDLCAEAVVTIDVLQVATSTTSTTTTSTSTTTAPGESTTSTVQGGSIVTTTTVLAGNLPFTGAQIGMLALLGLSATGLGGALIVSSRGRRHAGRHRL